MGITRKEAIEILQENHDFAQAYYDLTPNPEEVDPETVKYLQALQVALSALRPVSRELVEKVFSGTQACRSCRSCVFSIRTLKEQPCKKCDPDAKCMLTKYKPTPFCPVCGKALTDEAMQTLIERLEDLRDA